MKFIKPDFLRARAINNSAFTQVLRALKFLDGEGATNITRGAVKEGGGGGKLRT